MKIILVIIVFLMLILTSVSAKEDRTHLFGSTTSEVQRAKPVLTEAYPDLSSSALLIKSPPELVQFFKNKGIDSQVFADQPTPGPMVKVIQSICSENDTEFCRTMRKIVQKYRDTHYDAVVVQLGSVYWTVYV